MEVVNTYNITSNMNGNVVDLAEYKKTHEQIGEQLTYEKEGMAVILKFPLEAEALSAEDAESSISEVLRFELRNNLKQR